MTAAPRRRGPLAANGDSRPGRQPGGIVTVTGTVMVAVVASGNVTVVSAVVNTVVPWNGVPGSVIGLEDGGDLAGQRLGDGRLEGRDDRERGGRGRRAGQRERVGGDARRRRAPVATVTSPRPSSSSSCVSGERRADAEQRDHGEAGGEREVAGGAARPGRASRDGRRATTRARLRAGSPARSRRRIDAAAAGGGGRSSSSDSSDRMRPFRAGSMSGTSSTGGVGGRGRRAAADQHVEQPAELAEVVGRRRVGDGAAERRGLQHLRAGAAEDGAAGAVEHDRLAADGAVHAGARRAARRCASAMSAPTSSACRRGIGDAGAEARALDVLLDDDRVELGVGAGLRPREDGREAGVAHRLVPGRRARRTRSGRVPARANRATSTWASVTVSTARSRGTPPMGGSGAAIR